MDLNKSALKQLAEVYALKKEDITSRLSEFARTWAESSDEDIFTELAFCLLTPQSRAKSCWEAILTLKAENLLLEGSVAEIKTNLRCVRFHNKKARYLVEARNLFLKDGRISIKPFLQGFADVYECREWLVKNIKGLGYKEAGHFLRNIGFGEKISILDRHILRNLFRLGVIEGVPESLGRTKYLEIERKMSAFSRKINIPLAHLDLLLWYKETGEIFK